MNISNKSNYEETISNLTSIDLVVLAAMHETDLKPMIKISALELVKSCEKFFDLEMMQKMNHEPTQELKIKIQNWLNSIEYKQYTQNTNQTLSVKDKERIRKIYSKLGLKSHDLSELTQAGELFLKNKINEKEPIEKGINILESIIKEISENGEPKVLSKYQISNERKHG